MNIKYYIVKTVDGAITQITEKKTPERDHHGRFTAGYTIRFRQAKDCAAEKKEAMPLVKAALAENHDEFAGDGVTIGDYKFKLVVREELTAIRV